MIELQYCIEAEVKDNRDVKVKVLAPYSGTFLGSDLFEATKKADEWYNKNIEHIKYHNRDLILTTPVKDPICKDYDSVYLNSIDKPNSISPEDLIEYLKQKV